VGNITEAELQIQIAEYIIRKYPTALFHSDFGSGVKLTPGQAVKQKKMNGGRRAWPDMIILREFDINGLDSPVLFLELKREGTRLKKKNGDWATEHIAEQARMLRWINDLGLEAEFAVGFDEAKALIDEFLERPLYDD